VLNIYDYRYYVTKNFSPFSIFEEFRHAPGKAVRICDFSTHLGSVDLLAVSLHASEAV